VTEPWSTIAEITRVLKPGGRLVLSAPQAWRVHEAPHDYYRFTKYGLRFLAENNGLIVEQVYPLGGVWAVIGQTILNIIPHNRLFYLTAPINLLINPIFLLLDTIWPDRKETLDNILIARKPD
jgi:SAM-dependent methyltransferase